MRDLIDFGECVGFREKIILRIVDLEKRIKKLEEVKWMADLLGNKTPDDTLEEILNELKDMNKKIDKAIEL